MTKPTKWHVGPAKTQISQGIGPVWSESLLSTWRKLGFLATHWAHSEDWSDWVDAKADLSLRWARSHFVGFVTRRVIYLMSMCMTKPTKWLKCPGKTEHQPGPVWSESAVHSMGSWGPKGRKADQTGWSQSFLGTHVILLVLLWCSSGVVFVFRVDRMPKFKLPPHAILAIAVALCKDNRYEGTVYWKSGAVITKFEPEYDKTNKMTCVPSEDSDQLGHLACLIKAFAVCFMGS